MFPFFQKNRIKKQNTLSSGKRGFTLIELLIVIAIIGILSSVVLVSLTSARKKARDTQRKSDINQIAKALQVYYLEYGILPTTSSYGQNGYGGWDTSMEGGDFMQFLEGTPAGYPAVNPRNVKYFSDVPIDPKNDACDARLFDVCASGGSPRYGYRYYYYSPSYCAVNACVCKGKTGPYFKIDYRSEATNVFVDYCESVGV